MFFELNKNRGKDLFARDFSFKGRFSFFLNGNLNTIINQKKFSFRFKVKKNVLKIYKVRVSVKVYQRSQM